MANNISMTKNFKIELDEINEGAGKNEILEIDQLNS